MRLSSLVVASALLTLSASPVVAQGVMIRRPAPAPQTQSAPRAEAKPESSAVATQEPKAQEPAAQDPREDIRKIVREELRAALRELRAAEARTVEKKPEVAVKPDAVPTRPAPAPQAVAVTPAEPAPAARPVRVRAMQQSQDPAAPKPVARTEPAAKKSQEEVIAELEAELRGIQAEIERSMTAEPKPVAKAPAQTKQDAKPREPKAIAVQPPKPAEGPDAPRRMMVRMQEREAQNAPAPTEAKRPATIRSYTGEVMEGQPRRMMVLRTDENSDQPMVIEMAPEEFDRKIEQDLRVQADKGGIKVFRAETKGEQPKADDRGGCNCNCACCVQHRGGQAEAREPSPQQQRPMQDRVRWLAAPGIPGGDKAKQQMMLGVPMPPMAQGDKAPMAPVQGNPEARKQAMDRLRAQIDTAQRRLRALEEADRGQQDRGPARDGRGRNVEFRRGRDV